MFRLYSSLKNCNLTRTSYGITIFANYLFIHSLQARSSPRCRRSRATCSASATSSTSSRSAASGEWRNDLFHLFTLSHSPVEVEHTSTWIELVVRSIDQLLHFEKFSPFVNCVNQEFDLRMSCIHCFPLLTHCRILAHCHFFCSSAAIDGHIDLNIHALFLGTS